MTLTPARSLVAYFSMEICLEQAIPTYSGGLGVLAGDTLRSAADLGVPLVAVTLLHRKGYFEQHLDASGQQTEQPVHWSPEKVLEPVDGRSTVLIEGREVHVRAWKYTVKGVRGHEVPVYLLDTNLPQNSEWDRTLTDTLYGGDEHYRLCQEIVLGMGGAALLLSMGIDGETIYHLNEGHSALLTLQLLERQLDGRQHFELDDADLESVRQRCIFTTHTPVPAGHDKFPLEMVRHVLGDERVALLEGSGGVHEGMLNMTHLALHLTRFVNGVAMRHRDVSRGMFPGYPINSITNGVHAVTWTGPEYAALFDRRIPEWRRRLLGELRRSRIRSEAIRGEANGRSRDSRCRREADAPSHAARNCEGERPARQSEPEPDQRRHQWNGAAGRHRQSAGRPPRRFGGHGLQPSGGGLYPERGRGAGRLLSAWPRRRPEQHDAQRNELRREQPPA